MLIFVNDEPYQIPKKELEELKKEFPGFFKTGNGATPVEFSFPDVLNQHFLTKENKSRVNMAKGRNISLRSKRNIEGMVCEVVVCEKAPKNKQTEEYDYRGTSVYVSRGTGLRPGSDVAILWYLWFCANEVKGNKNDITSISAFISFIQPEKIAVTAIQTRRLINKLDNLLIGDNLLAEARIRHFALSMDEHRDAEHTDIDMLRYEMSTRVQQDEAYRLKLEALLSSEGKGSEQIINFIGTLKARGVISHHGAHLKWEWKDDREEKLIYKTNKEVDLSAEEQLAKHVGGNSALLAEFEKEVKASK